MPSRIACIATVVVGVVALGLPASSRAAECLEFAGEAVKDELGIALVAGAASLYPTATEVGVEAAVGCLLTQYNGASTGTPGLWRQAAIGLLTIMTVDPVRFFAALEATPAITVQRWLQHGLQMSQNEYIGKCVFPDRFDQAQKSLSGVELETSHQRDLLLQVQSTLESLTCREPG